MCFRSQGGHGPAVAGTGGDRYTRDMYPPVRLVAIDMDGTLLPTFSQSISRRNAQALKAAQEAGITCLLYTSYSLVLRIPFFPVNKIPPSDIRDWAAIKEWGLGIARQVKHAA